MTDASERKSGVAGVVKLIASVTVALLALLALLYVFEIVPRESLGTLTWKILLTAAIAAVASVVVGLLLRTRGR